jgi:hypothetical protein
LENPSGFARGVWFYSNALYETRVKLVPWS